MKKIVFILLIAFASVNGQAQLKNTKWKGTIVTDTQIDVILNYLTDTLDVLNLADESSIETMIFSVKDSVLSLKKIFGQSDCDESSIGSYKFEIKDGLMYLTLISDICDRRAAVLHTSKWTKIE